MRGKARVVATMYQKTSSIQQNVMIYTHKKLAATLRGKKQKLKLPLCDPGLVLAVKVFKTAVIKCSKN